MSPCPYPPFSKNKRYLKKKHDKDLLTILTISKNNALSGTVHNHYQK